MLVVHFSDYTKSVYGAGKLVQSQFCSMFFCPKMKRLFFAHAKFTSSKQESQQLISTEKDLWSFNNSTLCMHIIEAYNSQMNYVNLAKISFPKQQVIVSLFQHLNCQRHAKSSLKETGIPWILLPPRLFEHCVLSYKNPPNMQRAAIINELFTINFCCNSYFNRPTHVKRFLRSRACTTFSWR